MMNELNTATAAVSSTATAAVTMQVVAAPQWMHQIVQFRTHVFDHYFEPCIVHMFGPVVVTDTATMNGVYNYTTTDDLLSQEQHTSSYHHRRLNFLPNYVSDITSLAKETSMSFATLIMLFVTMFTLSLIFLSCFYHNQKTSPLFISPRKHRLPQLVPPPLPVDGYFAWMKICFYISDEEIIHRIGYDSLIFLRFHRLALRCIVKMSVFSFVVLLPLNFTGEGHANAFDIKEYVGSLFFTDFLLFTMANVQKGSPRLWVHCFAAYLLTAIVIRELLREYETFHNIRHRYLLSKEPHLRTVLVTNIAIITQD
jgi:Late exocytosis, associated with Golgi transport